MILSPGFPSGKAFLVWPLPYKMGCVAISRPQADTCYNAGKEADPERVGPEDPFLLNAGL
jgi:hypothetical protein